MPQRPDRKHQGEVTELAFMHKAAALGFVVTKPWGDNTRYDFIVDSDGHLTRVQVRSVSLACRPGCYHVGAGSGGHRKHPNTRAHIDLLAVYLIPEDIWYLIPISAFAPRVTINLHPNRLPPAPFEQFRDAWRLLRAPALCVSARL
jgi:hypothetical protein